MSIGRKGISNRRRLGSRGWSWRGQHRSKSRRQRTTEGSGDREWGVPPLPRLTPGVDLAVERVGTPRNGTGHKRR